MTYINPKPNPNPNKNPNPNPNPNTNPIPTHRCFPIDFCRTYSVLAFRNARKNRPRPQGVIFYRFLRSKLRFDKRFRKYQRQAPKEGKYIHITVLPVAPPKTT